VVHGSMEGRPVDCDTTGEIFTPLHPNRRYIADQCCGTGTGTVGTVTF
jgi:hypothetical protein